MSDEIGAICAKVLADALKRRDADAIGALIERLARALGFSIAVAANGNKQVVEKLLSGAEAYAMEEAVEKAKFVAFMNKVTRP